MVETPDKINYKPLNNHYYAMRHGQSMANCAGIIVSHPDNGIKNYGLSSEGKQQVRQSLSLCTLEASTLVFCSDFKRTQETAGLVHEILGCHADIEMNTRLRERNFGQLELGSDQRYPEIWRADLMDVNHNLHRVESVGSVLKRATQVIDDLEQRFKNETCLLVAHGDILQILQTAFYQLPASQHRDLPHLNTAEIRLLNRQISDAQIN